MRKGENRFATIIGQSLKERRQGKGKLELVFMKHYGPNICLPLMITWKQDAKVRKRFIVQSNIYRNLPKVNQVIYRFHRLTMHKSEKGDNSAKYLQTFAKR